MRENKRGQGSPSPGDRAIHCRNDVKGNPANSAHCNKGTLEGH